MSSGRRVNDRRRRVLYSANQADASSSTAASRSEARRLREARRPQEAYGSRVHRRLRARWFSLVPVRRRAMIAFSVVLIVATVLLCLAHCAAVSWPSIAYRPEVARPLRLDRPDSFGHCMMVALLTASMGASLLIYQLRRYRNDDFKGQYRLWRLVMIVMALASVNAMVGMIDWSGAILDSLFGKRVALTGSDWTRLVVSFGGAVLAIRLIAEVRRCRVSMMLMLVAWTTLAIPEAANWNVLTVETLNRWILVTSAPLIACTALFLSLGIYLRMLYREVRQIVDGEPMLDRLRLFQARLFQPSPREDEDQSESKTAARTGPEKGQRDENDRRWWQRKRPAKTEPSTVRVAKHTTEINEASRDHELEGTRPSTTVTRGDRGEEKPRDAKPHAKRRWFGLRRAKPETTKADRREGIPDRKQADHASATASTSTNKSRFSLRLKPPTTEPDSANAPRVTEKSEAKRDKDTDTKRTSLLSWFRRGNSKNAKSGSVTSGSKPSTANDASPNAPGGASDNDIDGDDIDWNSLNKSERRRLRKQLKRQNRAA